MPGDAGLIAKAIETIFGWVTGEDGLKEMQKRRRLASKKEECRRALQDHRFDDLRRLTDEYERMSNEA